MGSAKARLNLGSCQQSPSSLLAAALGSSGAFSLPSPYAGMLRRGVGTGHGSKRMMIWGKGILKEVRG